MKVFIISGKHPLQDSGGYATYAYSLCKCLLELGHEPHVIVFSAQSKVEETSIGIVHSVSSRISFLGTEGFPFWSFIFSRYINKIISKEDPAQKYIIHGIGPWGLTGTFLKRKHRDRIIPISSYFTTTGDEVYWLMRGIRITDYGLRLKLKYTLIYLLTVIFLKPFEKASIRKTDMVIVHYASSKDMLVRDYGTSEDIIKQIPYYSETYTKGKGESSQDNLGVLLDKPLCVTICRQEPRKGINYLLRALKIIIDKDENINPVIVGAGELLEKNKKLAKRLGIDDRVHFTGFVEDISPFLENADVFVHPSVQEGSGSISVLEAMRAGVPIVTAECDGMGEDIEDGISGLLVPIEDEVSLAEAIMKAMNNKSIASSMRENVVKAYNERFSLPAMIAGIGELYASLDV